MDIEGEENAHSDSQSQSMAKNNPAYVRHSVQSRMSNESMMSIPDQRSYPEKFLSFDSESASNLTCLRSFVSCKTTKVSLNSSSVTKASGWWASVVQIRSGLTAPIPTTTDSTAWAIRMATFKSTCLFTKELTRSSHGGRIPHRNRESISGEDHLQMLQV